MAGAESLDFEAQLDVIQGEVNSAESDFNEFARSLMGALWDVAKGEGDGEEAAVRAREDLMLRFKQH